MKKKLLSALLTAVMLVTSVPAALAAKNDDVFTVDPDNVISSWGGFNSEGQMKQIRILGGTLEYKSVAGVDESGCVKATIGGGSGWDGIRIPVQLAIGETYDITFDVRGDMGGSISLIFYYSNGGYDTVLLNKLHGIKADWSTYTNTWTCTGKNSNVTATTGIGEFEVRLGDGQVAGEYYIDNFTLKPHYKASNVEDYGSFLYRGDDPNKEDNNLDSVSPKMVAFTDVENHWAKETTNLLATYGYIDGIGDNLYAPNKNVTRAEFVKMMTDALNLQTPSDLTVPYTDVAKDAWYAAPVRIANGLGLLDPAMTFGNRFFPDQAITREEAASIAAKIAVIRKVDKKDNGVSFGDMASVSSWAQDGVKAAAEYGVIRGYEDGTYKPKANITRAESAEILMRVVEFTRRFNIYVDQATGSDKNDGTKGAPLKSLLRAVEMVREYNMDMQNDIYVRIKGRQYLEDTIKLGTKDSGMNGYRVIYTSWGDEKAEISMGTKHTGFKLHDAKNNIYSVGVGSGREVRQVYFNGVSGIRSRSVAGLKNPKYVTGGIVSEDTQLLDFKYPEKVELIHKTDWRFSKIVTTKVTDQGDGTILIEPKSNIIGKIGKAAYPAYLENAYEFLDQPGEWYLDHVEGTLYYIPRDGEDMSAMVATVPKGENLLQISGSSGEDPAKRIVFDNLEFCEVNDLKAVRDGGWAGNQNGGYAENGWALMDHAVTVSNAYHVDFTNNKFEHMAKGALLFERAVQYCDVIGNEFFDLGGNAVNLGSSTTDGKDVKDTAALNRYNRVNNNYVHQIGREHMSAVGIAATWPRHTQINHNEIVNTPYSGMHIGWGWDDYVNQGTVLHDLEINNNYIHEYITDRLYDSGGIYIVGTSSLENPDLKNRITGNYFQNARNAYGAVYPDQGASDWHIYENVIDDKDVLNWRTNWGEKGIKEKDQLLWLHIWKSTIRRNTAENNYTTNAGYRADGEKATTIVQNNQVIPDANWPEEAQNIIANAGIEDAYIGNFETITGPQSLVTRETDYTVTPDAPVKLDIKVTGQYDKEYPLSDFDIDYWVSDPNLLEISPDGVMTAKGVGLAFVEVSALVDGVQQVKTCRVTVDADYNRLEPNKTSLQPLVGYSAKLTINAVSPMERKLAVPDENTTYESLDTSIATVDADGTVHGLTVGETTIKVKAEYRGMTIDTEIPVKVSSYSQPDTLELPFTKANSDLFVASKWSGYQAVPEDGGVAVKGEPGRLDGSAGSGLIAFDLIIKEQNGWPSLMFGLTDRMGTYGSADCYLIGFKPTYIEFQRFNKGKRTYFFGDETSLGPVAGPGIPNTADDPVFKFNERMSVITGALDTGNGTRVVLIINGKPVFDYLDNLDGYIPQGGYFGIYAPEDFVFLPYTGIGSQETAE